MLYQAENKFDTLISAAAGMHGIPVPLIKAVFANESRFNPGAVGDAGKAHGIGQMWLTTARGLGYTGPQGDPASGTGLYDPRIAIPLTAKYLAQQMRRYGNVPAALSGYNAGHSMIPVTGPEQIPHAGNREYVRKGIIHYNLYTGALTAQDATAAIASGTWQKIAVIGAAGLGILALAILGLLLFAAWRG